MRRVIKTSEKNVSAFLFGAKNQSVKRQAKIYKSLKQENI